MNLTTWANDRHIARMATHEELQPVYEQWLMENYRVPDGDALLRLVEKQTGWTDFLRSLQ